MSRIISTSAALVLALLTPGWASASPAFVSLDASRSNGTGAVNSASTTGELMSFSIGSNYEPARQTIVMDFPGSTFTAVPELTSASLAGDIFVSGLLAEGQDLTAAEQAVLFDHVAGGGAALIFGDLDRFLDASNSLVAPFSVSFGGSSLAAPVTATFTDPTHPIADGPFGTLSTFTEGYVTAVTDLGPHATSIATNLLGTTLAVIPRNAIGPGSGPVVIYSDASPFQAESPAPFNFEDNRLLFRNTIAYLVSEPCPGDVDGDGITNLSDLAIILANFGATPSPRDAGDLDGDTDVDLADLAILLANFGQSCD